MVYHCFANYVVMYQVKDESKRLLGNPILSSRPLRYCGMIGANATKILRQLPTGRTGLAKMYGLGYRALGGHAVG